MQSFHTNTNYFIQDQRTQRMIGFGEKLEGLYHLMVDPKDASVLNVQVADPMTLPKEALWHFRLGHIQK